MHYPASDLVIDPVLIRKYDVGGPRYASYPTADRFIEALGEADLQQCLARRDVGGISPALSLYVHLPFDHDRGQSAKYIKYLEKELALLAAPGGQPRDPRDALDQHAEFQQRRDGGAGAPGRTSSARRAVLDRRSIRATPSPGA